MEQEFRTTFIPKKPLVQPPVSSGVPVSRPVGIIFTVTLIIFVITLISGAGVYLYKNYLTNEIKQLSESLEKLQQQIDPNVIREFSLMDKRLKNSETLLNQHAIISPLFTILRTTTLPTVRYTKFDTSFTESRDLQVTMSGESDGYRSIALQAQALAKNANLKDTIFSNFAVTPKGRVAFDISFIIPVADIAFTKHLEQFSSPTPIITSDTVFQTVTQTTNSFDGIQN